MSEQALLVSVCVCVCVCVCVWETLENTSPQKPGQTNKLNRVKFLHALSVCSQIKINWLCGKEV